MTSTNLAKTFVTWLVFFNWPGLLIGVLVLWPTLRETVPSLVALAFIPGLFWINIPAIWLGLAKSMGPEHFCS
jgi:hypothetical protein